MPLIMKSTIRMWYELSTFRRNTTPSVPKCKLATLADLLCEPEDGGSTFLLNDYELLADCTASHYRRWYSLTMDRFVNNLLDTRKYSFDWESDKRQCSCSRIVKCKVTDIRLFPKRVSNLQS
jgi:hypothetical protein